MRQIVSLLVCAIMLLTLVGCSVAQPSEQPTESVQVTPIHTPKPSPSDTPTPTPSPTPEPVDVPIEITSGVLYTEYNVTNLELTVHNTGSVGIDAYDADVQAYNNYGELVQQYSLDATTISYNAGGDFPIIQPGDETDGDVYWSLYGVKNAAMVKVAITRCHTTSGDTINVPEGQYKWIEVRYK